MSNKKRLLYCLIAGIVLGNVVFWTNRCSKQVIESVERDTVVVYDTIPHYYPVPKDSAVVKYVTRYLRRTDTVDQFIAVNNMTDHFADTSNMIAVEVPITSKHYSCKDYDAWVSGYEPSLDSIKVYQRTEVVTITKIIKSQKHFFLDVGAGCEYIPNTKTAVPFTELGLSFKSGKFGIGAYGGYSHDINENKAMPYAKAKITFDIISF